MEAKLPSGTFGTGLILNALLARAIFSEIRGMTPEERERLNNLCKRIEKVSRTRKCLTGSRRVE